jgi:prepilin-type N-terminal cleavage/methylation domain-containing protein
MKLRRTYSAFTLIELLTVIAIIGILAAVTAPVLNGFRKGDAMLAATRMMLDGVGHARQLAISQHTTVYMVFVPTNFWQDTAYNLSPQITPADRAVATNLADKQLTGFGFVSLRSIGDQPGQGVSRYLSGWQSLPEKAFIAQWKFNLGINQTLVINDNISGEAFAVHGFNTTNNIPFPREDTKSFSAAFPWVRLPYIAFDYQGRLVSGDGQLLGRDEYIPLAHGSVAPALNGATKTPILVAGAAPSVQEQKPGNSTNSAYNLIHIDWLTGRARLEHQSVR